MATRVITQLIDDIDGGEAHSTVRFALDGTDYTIDLSEDNEQELRDALAQYITHASRSGRAVAINRAQKVTRSNGSNGSGLSRDDRRLIREWALNKGIEISDRGRIKAEIIDRYHDELASRREHAETTSFIRRQAEAVAAKAAPKVQQPPLDEEEEVEQAPPAEQPKVKTTAPATRVRKTPARTEPTPAATRPRRTRASAR